MAKVKKSNYFYQRMAVGLLAMYVMVMLSGCYFLPQEEEILAPPLKEPEQVTYKTTVVELGNVERYIKGNGYFVSTASETLQFGNVSGKIRDIYVKNGDEVKKGQLIAEFETGDLEYNIQEQSIQVKIAEVNLANAKNGGVKNTIEIAQYNLQLAQLKLQKLRQQLEEARLYAGMDGVVVYKNDISAGETIGAYTTIVKISDPKSLQITFTHDDVDELQNGMEMELQIGNREETYVGKIVQVPADLPPDATDAEKKMVRIDMETIPDDVELGDSVYISLLMEKRENVVVLPMSAISKVGTRRYVRVLKDGIPEERDVELGLQSNNMVEIVSGLEVGETIVI